MKTPDAQMKRDESNLATSAQLTFSQRTKTNEPDLLD